MRISLDYVKQKLQKDINDISMENFEQTLTSVKKGISIIEYLHNEQALTEDEVAVTTEESADTPIESDNNDDEEDRSQDRTAETETAASTERSAVAESDSKTQNESEHIAENEYRFKKLLNGGTIEGIKESHLSESIVRSMDLKTGDILYVEDTQNIMNGLRLVRKSDKEIDDGIVVMPMATIKQEAGMLYCDDYYDKDSQTTKPMRIYDAPYKHYLNDYVTDAYQLKEGDMLDLGYEKNNPNHIRIVWKHQSYEHTTPMPSSHYKDKDKDKEKEKHEPSYAHVNFHKKKILVIGCEPRKGAYEQAVTQCNGEFLFLTGDEKMHRAEPLIRQADIIVMLRDQLSHKFVQQSVRFAKKHGKPFSVPDGLGQQNLILEAQLLMMKKAK